MKIIFVDGEDRRDDIFFSLSIVLFSKENVRIKLLEASSTNMIFFKIIISKS